MVTEQPQYSVVVCIFSTSQNAEISLIPNGLHFIFTYPQSLALAILLHIARHSFANIARQKKANVYDISKALGHTSLKITETYLSKFDTTSQDETMKQVFDTNSINEELLIKQLQGIAPDKLRDILKRIEK